MLSREETHRQFAFSRGETEAWVRLDEVNDIKATEAAKILTDNKTQIVETVPSLVEALTGEAEEAYHTKIRERIAAKKGKGRKGGRKQKRVRVD